MSSREIREEVLALTASGDRAALRPLIEQCRNLHDGLSILREAAASCYSRWHDLKKDLTDAASFWTPPDRSKPQARSSSSKGPRWLNWVFVGRSLMSFLSRLFGKRQGDSETRQAKPGTNKSMGGVPPDVVAEVGCTAAKLARLALLLNSVKIPNEARGALSTVVDVLLTIKKPDYSELIALANTYPTMNDAKALDTCAKCVVIFEDFSTKASKMVEILAGREKT